MLKNDLKHSREALTDVRPLVAAYVQWAKDCPDRWEDLSSRKPAQKLDPEIRRAVEERLAADRREFEAERLGEVEEYKRKQFLREISSNSDRYEAVCRSVDLEGAAKRPIGTVCNPKDRSNWHCTDLLCMHGKMVNGGFVRTPSGLMTGFPSTRVEGYVELWRKGRWQKTMCYVSFELLGTMHAGSDGFGPEFVSDAAMTRRIDEELDKCLQQIRREPQEAANPEAGKPEKL